MPDHRNNIKDVPWPYSHHPAAWLGSRKSQPVGSKPQIPDWSPEHFDCYAATAEQSARTTFGVVDNADCCGGGTDFGHAPWCRGVPDRVRLYRENAHSFHARVARDNRAYLVGTTVLALGLVAMLGCLWLFRPAPIKVAEDKVWCGTFRQALSCPGAEHKAGKDDRSHR